MAARNFLAFDLGAESGRALLGRLENGELTLEEKHRFANPNGRMNGHLHWNVLAQWEELKTGLRKAAAGGEVIHAIGVDTWGVDVGFLDREGDLLANPYMYRDPQTTGILERAFAKVPRAELFETTGIQIMPINTLFHLMAMAERKSPILENAQTMLFMPDLFNYLFTGEKVAEFSIATTSQMYDPRAKDWARDLLGKLGIPTHFLPKIVPTATRLANVRAEIMKECGATCDIPVIATAGHDTAAAVAAVPVEEGAGDWCYISSGTWSLMGVELREPIINAKSLALNYTNEGGVGGTIRFLKNIMGLWLVQECRRQWLKEGRELTYAELTRMAAEVRPFQAVIDPNHASFMAPGEMPQKVVAFCEATSQKSPTSPGAIIRVCLESLALTYRKTVEGLEEILGKKLNVIHIVGGGTQNELLNQMTADATGKPVIAGPIEATAIGNIGVTAMATGDIASLAELRTIVRQSFSVKRYDPQNRAAWDTAYQTYRGIVRE